MVTDHPSSQTPTPARTPAPTVDPWRALDAPPIDSTLEPADLRAGDLLFCARPSGLQRLCTRAGEPWRHVGPVAGQGEELAISEVAGARFGTRSISRAMDAYDVMAVGRVADRYRPAAVQAARWTLTRAGDAQIYA